MQYITYSEYNSMGGVCDLTAFDRYIDRACGIIDVATHNRIEAMESVPRQAKAACRDLVEYLANNADTSEKTVASRSQSAGSVSESESYVAKSVDDMRNDVDNLLFDYLGSVTDDKGIPLLYRGCIG